MSTTTSPDVAPAVAADVSVKEAQARAAIALLDEGSTVPFIARYRKEVTDGLDDSQLRLLEERLRYRREMEDRRAAVLKSVADQGKLTDELKLKFLRADSKADLEDLYLPYKPKRRTKAMIAREAGLEPLAEALLADPRQDPVALAETFIDADKGVEDGGKALEGARQILMEQFAETPEVAKAVRERMGNEAVVISKVVPGKEKDGEKFADYFDYQEPISQVPPHRALALFRGRKAEVLSLDVKLPEEMDLDDPRAFPPQAAMIAAILNLKDDGRPADAWMKETVRWTWKVKMAFRTEGELFSNVFEQSEDESIRVFAENLRDLLLSAPAGPKAVLALDPGYRTGCKVAVVDPTGKLLDTATIYPHQPQNKWNDSIALLGAMVLKHSVELIAVGNGTASRETDKLAGDLISTIKKAGHKLNVTKAMVSEAGASVYSASEFASREFPDLDVSIRGAVSIARRLQDPLAELVKIEPKSIGVGQYQHDVSQPKLARALNAVVEDCVNGVGVDLNTASAPLLSRVSGLSESLAQSIVSHRDENGPFKKRSDLKKVARLGPKAFEQAAGFLRIMDGAEPLDSSAVHPEAYPIARKIADAAGKPIKTLIGDRSALKSLNPAQFADERFGLPTVKDIFAELEKPGRDPRPEFKTAAFVDGIEKVSDLRPGMMLEGVVTNVAAFGAFVDVGVHQDGLVHVSALSEQFVKDPRDVVRPGQVVKVKVMEVDVGRKRIGLSMRMSDEPGAKEERVRGGGGGASPKRMSASPAKSPRVGGGGGRGHSGASGGASGASVGGSSTGGDADNPFAAAFAKAKRDKGA
ncbi:MAG: RNA-binding transcriptional accessory protein [Rhodobacteraceae bacterium]|nr:RNA-binding transcriptional accessory protein [Paracoccaceae bacterium]